MVPLSERDSIIRRLEADSEMPGLCSFIFGEHEKVVERSSVPQNALLCSIAKRDVAIFTEVIGEIERRRITEDSNWCDNDCLVFLIILGCKLFDIQSPCVEAIMAVREVNRNVVPRRVNQIFRSLSRDEYAMEGDYCFIKITFLELLSRLRMSSEDALKGYDSLVRPGLLGELSPFLQLLALRAYDLALHDRIPTKVESLPQLIEGLAEVSGKLSLRQAWQLICALPLKVYLISITGLIALASGFGSYGLKLADYRLRHESERKRPEQLVIASSEVGDKESERILRDLTITLSSMPVRTAEKKIVVIAAHTRALGRASPKFSVEVFHAQYPVLEAYSLLSVQADGGTNFTIVQEQKMGNGFRAFFPASPGSANIIFLMSVECPRSESVSSLMPGVRLRILE